MNNGMNNNVNNANNMENPAGMNFMQNSVPTNGVPVGGTNVSNGVNQMPQGVNQMPMGGMQTLNNSMPGAMPLQGMAGFSSTGTPGQMPQGMSQAVNQQPMGGMANAPMSGAVTGQVQPPVSSMQNFNQPMMPGGVQQSPMMSNGGMVGNNGNNVNTDGDSQGEKQKNPIVLIIITIVVVVGVVVFLILFLTGKINFGASSNNNQGNGNIVDEVDDAQVSNGLVAWMNYLLQQNIAEITLSKYNTDDLSNPTVVNLTMDQLENIFTEMVDYGLVKYYTSNEETNSSYELRVTYSSNDDNFEFWISDGRIGFDDDSALLESFENVEYTTQSDGETSVDSEDYIFILDNFDSAVYSKYFEAITDDTDGDIETDE